MNNLNIAKDGFALYTKETATQFSKREVVGLVW